MLCIVHLVESLHGGADLWAGHLLVEGVDEAVGARAILLRDDEGVELWITLVCLRPERQAFRHAQLRGEVREESVIMLKQIIQFHIKTIFCRDDSDGIQFWLPNPEHLKLC